MSQSIIGKFKTYARDELGLSQKTVVAYLYDVQEFLRFTKQKDVTAQLIEDFIGHLQRKGLKSTSIRRKSMSIRCLCNCLTSLGRLDPNILKMIDSVHTTRRTPNALEPSDVDALISTVENRVPLSRATNVHRDRTIILMLYHSGLRVSELCQLNLDDINFIRREIRVRGKGGRDRIVPTTSKCIEAIQKYLDSERQSDIKAVFVKSNGERLTRRSVSDMLTSLLRRAGIKNTTAHTLRRACATQLLNNNMDLEMIQKFLGHKHLSTTELYLSVNFDKLKSVHAQYHPFGAKYVKNN